MNRSKFLYILLIVIVMPLTGFGIDIYTPSLPAISSQLHVPFSAVKMTISLYLIGLCIGQLCFGAWSDSYGRKPTLIVGSIGFVLLSLIIPMIPNIYFIIFMRLLQGFFVAAMAVNCRSIIADVFTKEELPIASTYMTMAWSIGPIIAPLIGGYLQYYISWQSNFYFLASYGLIILSIIVSCFKETNLQRVKHPLKRIFTDYVTIIKHRQFMGALLLMAIGYAILVIFPLISPFLVQNIFHQSPITYGRLALLIGLTYLVGSLTNRYLLHFFAMDNLIKYSLFALILLNILFVFISVVWSATLYTLYMPTLLIVMSIGFLFPNCMGKSISYFAKMAGKAGAVVGTGFMFLTAIISIITNYLPIHSQLSLAITFLVLSLFGLFARKILQ